MPNSELATFPSNKTEALVMLYLQKQDFSGLTPSDLVDKYYETYDEIRNRTKEVRSQRQSSSGWTL